MIKLEVLNTAFKGKRFRFRDGLTVGKGPTCSIRAEHEGLQDTHARFYTDPDGRAMVEISNQQSRLYVNGKDVMRTELRHHDEITIGPLKFRVIDSGKISSASLRFDQLLEHVDQSLNNEIYDFAREDLFYLTTKDPSLRSCLNFSIPSKDRFIDQAQVFLTRLVKHSGMIEEQVDAFMTCAKELILNAHRHGHKFDETKKILIRYRDHGTRLSLSIEDEGAGFDHRAILEAVRNRDAAKAARERYQAGGFGGLGFQLITKLAPDLAYNEAGNTVTFSIAKDPALAEQGEAAEEA